MKKEKKIDIKFLAIGWAATNMIAWFIHPILFFVSNLSWMILLIVCDLANEKDKK